MYAVEFQELQHVAQKRCKTSFVSMQCHYNLLYREEEREMLRYCQKSGIGCLAVRHPSMSFFLLMAG